MSSSSIKYFFTRLIALVTFCTLAGLFFLATLYITERQSLRYKARELLTTPSGRLQKVLFSPDNSVQDTLIGLIDQEKERISIAIFSLTNTQIAKALARARRRGVIIEVVADRENSKKKYSIIKKMRSLALWLYPKDALISSEEAGIMHNKFALFHRSFYDRPVLWTGSFNFTRAANDKNQENVIVTDNEELFSAYKAHFEELKKRSARITHTNLLHST